MSHITKLILSALLKRVKSIINEELSDVHLGYKPGKGMGNTPYNFKVIIENCIEQQNDLHNVQLYEV